MEKYFGSLKAHIMQEQPDFCDGESVLTLLYEAYSEVNRMDDTQIKADFNGLYRLMNGMELREMNKIICPVCTLCRDHEKAGLAAGVKVGMYLKDELT